MIYLLIDFLKDWLYRVHLSPLVLINAQVQFRALAALGLSFVLVITLGRGTIRRLNALRLGDAGATDAELLKAHAASKAHTPTMGGILIAGSVAVSVLLLSDISRFYVQLGLVVLVWLAAVGGVDDYLKLTAARRGAGSRQGLYAWEKLVFQLGIGALAGWFAFRHGDSAGVDLDLAHVLNLPLQRTYEPGAGETPASGLIYLPAWAYVLLSTLMIAGMSNAVNITDGMDGLATGITAAVSLGLIVLCLIAGSLVAAQYLLVPHVTFADELAVIACGMLGACLGFLWWNCSPAQVFMGDTGSLSLGGLIGYLAIVTRQEAVVLVMGGVFLAEIGSVVLQVGYFKWTGGRRIFRCAPFHHHLHLAGWTEQQVVVRMWIVSFILVVLGLVTLKMR